MSYEIPLPNPALLKEKPLDSRAVMEMLVKEGFNPIAITADNNLGKVIVYFTEPLSSRESKKLMELVTDYYKKHVGLKKE